MKDFIIRKIKTKNKQKLIQDNVKLSEEILPNNPFHQLQAVKKETKNMKVNKKILTKILSLKNNS